MYTLRQILGLSEGEAKSFLMKYKLENRQPEFMTDSFETYKKLGFSIPEIIANGRLFKCSPREHEQHYWVMEEGGFSNLEAQIFTW